MGKRKRYRIPQIEEFVVGFEFESNFWYCSDSGEWENFILTEENIDVFLCLYRRDAYSHEFRVEI